MAPPIIPLKRCSQGGNCLHPNGPELPATTEYFKADKRLTSGLRAKCKACSRPINNASQRRRKLENPDILRKQRESQRKRRLRPEVREREREWYREYYYRSDVRARKIANNREWRHRPDNQQRLKQYQYDYERRPERRAKRRVRSWQRRRTPAGRTYLRQTGRVYSARHRARKLAAGGSYARADIELQFKSQKGRCWWCNCKLSGVWEVDHRIPISRGGSNAPRNLCISCLPCNRSKHDKLPHEWNGRLL